MESQRRRKEKQPQQWRRKGRTAAATGARNPAVSFGPQEVIMTFLVQQETLLGEDSCSKDQRTKLQLIESTQLKREG